MELLTLDLQNTQTYYYNILDNDIDAAAPRRDKASDLESLNIVYVFLHLNIIITR